VARGHRDHEHAEDERDQGDGGPAVEPLELLAALAVGAAVRRDLDEDPGQPGAQRQRDDDDVEDLEPAARRIG
jgi:hypothetical protein